MTRTFVVGDVPDDVRDVAPPLQGGARPRDLRDQGRGDGRAIFDGTCEIFEAAGEPTQRTKERGVPLADGFFHGLGHGVGLEVHEEPGLGLTSRRRSRPATSSRSSRALPAGLRRRPARGPRARDRRTAPRT